MACAPRPLARATSASINDSALVEPAELAPQIASFDTIVPCTASPTGANAYYPVKITPAISSMARHTTQETSLQQESCGSAC